MLDSAVEAASTARVRPARIRTAALRTGLGLCAGAVLILAFLRLVNVSAVYQRLEHLSIGFAVLCGVAFLAAYVVRALRWRVLLRPDEVSVGRAVGIYQVATFLNWLLPIRGGELANLFMGQTNCEIGYICDVDENVLNRMVKTVGDKQSRKPQGIRDFRKALDDKSLDALVCAAPNHWHAQGRDRRSDLAVPHVGAVVSVNQVEYLSLEDRLARLSSGVTGSSECTSLFSR